MGNNCFHVDSQGLASNCGSSGSHYPATYNGVTTVAFETRTVPAGQPFAGCSYDYLVIDGVSNYPSFNGGSATGTGVITQISCTYDCVTNACQVNTGGSGAYPNLSACQTSCKPPAYDCINGSCIQNTVHNTPGNFQTLAACQTTCGQENCPTCPVCPDPVPCVCDPCTCPDPVPCPDCPPCVTGACVCNPCPTAPPCPQPTCPTCSTCPPCHNGEDNVNFNTISVPVFSGACDSDGDPTMTNQSIVVIAGLEQTELLKFTELANTQGAITCPSGASSSDTAAVIEGWAIRPEYHRPQAIYQFAEVDNSGNYIGAPKYQIVVPHHISTQPTNPLPNYQKGNWLLIYVLNDNSKLTVYAYDETNAMAMLTAIQALIIPAMLTNGYLARSCLVQTTNQIAQINVKNRSAKYYSTGAKNAVPDWVVKW